METIERIKIFEAPVDVVSFGTALERVCELAKDRSRVHTVAAINTEKTFIMAANEEIRSYVEGADLIIPDGIGIVKAAKILYGRHLERVAGADLMQSICEASGKQGLKIYIYGARENVNASAVEMINKKYPDVQIVGRSNGYIPPEKNDDLISDINNSNADILFLALGSPMQEHWVRKNSPRLHVAVCMGIGGTLDTIVGTVKRAPISWQKCGLEWLYRFIKQPRRIYRSRRVFKYAFRVFWVKLFVGTTK